MAWSLVAAGRFLSKSEDAAEAFPSSTSGNLCLDGPNKYCLGEFCCCCFFLLCGEKIGIFDLCLLERTGSFLKIF